MLDDLVKGVDSKKPREEKLTYVTDKLQVVNKENWELFSQFVDVIKINGTLSLFTSDSCITKKYNSIMIIRFVYLLEAFWLNMYSYKTHLMSLPRRHAE